MYQDIDFINEHILIFLYSTNKRTIILPSKMNCTKFGKLKMNCRKCKRMNEMTEEPVTKMKMTILKGVQNNANINW